MKPSKSLVKAILVHITVFAVLAFQFHSATIRIQPAGNPDADKPIVQAVAVTEKQVLSEMKRLAEQQKKKELAKQQKLAEIEKKEKAAEQQKKKAEEKAKASEKQIADAKAKIEREKIELETKQKAIAAEKLALKKAAEEAEKKRVQAEVEKEKVAKIAAEKEKAAKLAAEKEKAAKLAEEARQKALQQESEALLQQALADEMQTAASMDEIQQYYGAIVRKIQQNWRRDYGQNNGLSCRIQVRLSSGGEVSDVKVLKSSGDAQFDRQAALAVLRSSPLPLPDNPRARQAFLSGFDFLFKPEG